MRERQVDKFEEWYQSTLTMRSANGPVWPPRHIHEQMKKLYRVAYEQGYKDAQDE